MGYLSDSLAADLPTGTDHYIKLRKLIRSAFTPVIEHSLEIDESRELEAQKRLAMELKTWIGFEADIGPIEVSNGDHGLSSMEDALLLLSLGIASLGTVSLFPAAKVSSDSN